MLLQANIFLLLFGAIQGFLLSIALLSKRERHSSHVFLTAFLVIIGLQLTFKVVTKWWLMENVGFFYTTSYSLPYLVGPIVYLFIRSRTRGASLDRTDVVHALPFLMQATVSIFAHLGFYGDYLWLNLSWVRGLGQLISLGAYTWISAKMVEGKTPRQFLIYVMSAEALVVIALAVMVRYYHIMPDLRLVFISLTVVIYWITWKMMTNSDLVPSKTVRYANSGLKEEESIRIENALRRLMSSEKLYTDSGLTIDKLAASLNTSRHHLSQVLNERVGRPYTEYICDLRLEEAQRRLSDPASSRYTIAAIAHDAGFSNVSTFNEAFKRRYGTTPSASRKAR